MKNYNQFYNNQNKNHKNIFLAYFAKSVNLLFAQVPQSWNSDPCINSYGENYLLESSVVSFESGATVFLTFGKEVESTFVLQNLDNNAIFFRMIYSEYMPAKMLEKDYCSKLY